MPLLCPHGAHRREVRGRVECERWCPRRPATRRGQHQGTTQATMIATAARVVDRGSRGARCPGGCSTCAPRRTHRCRRLRRAPSAEAQRSMKRTRAATTHHQAPASPKTETGWGRGWPCRWCCLARHRRGWRRTAPVHREVGHTTGDGLAAVFVRDEWRRPQVGARGLGGEAARAGTMAGRPSALRRSLRKGAGSVTLGVCRRSWRRDG